MGKVANFAYMRDPSFSYSVSICDLQFVFKLRVSKRSAISIASKDVDSKKDAEKIVSFFLRDGARRTGSTGFVGV